MTIPSGVNATTRPSALRRRLACLGTLLMLSGCGTNVLHNAADFKAATEADETSKKIDYAAVIRVERTVQAKILEHELSVVNDFAVARRNYALMNLMTAKKTLSENLGDRIAARQKVLTGDALPTLKNVTVANLVPAGAICGPGLAAADPALGISVWAGPGPWVLALEVVLEECVEELWDASETYQGTLRFGAPRCPVDGALEDFAKLSEGLVANYRKANPKTLRTDDVIKLLVGNEYHRYSGKCMTVRAHEMAGRALVEGCQGKNCGPGASANAVIVGLTGKLVEARKKVASATAALLMDKKAAQDAKDAYEAAQALYKAAAAKHAKEPSDATRTALKDAGEKLGNVLKLLGKAGGVFGQEIVAKEQIAKIDQIMKAASTGEYDVEAVKTACAADSASSTSCGLAQATAVAAHLPSFLDRVSRISTLAEAPPLSGLLLEKSRLLALKNLADKGVKRRQRQITLDAKQVKATLLEIELLRRGNQLLLQAGPMTAKQFVSPKTNEKNKELVLRALGKYLLTFTGPKRQMHANEYRLISLDHERALDYSEASANTWKAAIVVPVEALLAYHQSGLKPEDIAELLKALGLGGVALGVN